MILASVRPEKSALAFLKLYFFPKQAERADLPFCHFVFLRLLSSAFVQLQYVHEGNSQSLHHVHTHIDSTLHY